MSRNKKDGRHINYYIERSIYEKLKRFADEKGQSVTTAIERILEQYFDSCNIKQNEENKNSESGDSAQDEPKRR